MSSTTVEAGVSPAKNCSSVAARHAVVLTKAGATLDLAFVAACRGLRSVR
jgi:hypothetical protein